MSDRRGPLSHLRVLDMTRALAGPYCTLILGDLGAEIIKVEGPDGELSRHLPPHFLGEDSLYYYSINRNKQSLSLDLGSPAAIRIVEELAANCDVLVENFRPGVMEKLGLPYRRLSRTNPALIWCSISGYGQDGPYKNLPAYDMIIQALSGGMSLTGETDGSPVRAGIPLADLAGGMFGAIGILSALEERRVTGKGKLIDISLLDAQISMLCFQVGYHLFSGVVPGPQGCGHDSIATYRTFTARDGRDIVLAAVTEGMWQSLCRALEAPELLEDPRFTTNHERVKHKDELWPILEDIFKTRDAQDWTAALQEAQVPVGEVKTIDRALSDPQVLHREMVLSLTDPGGQSLKVGGNPIKLNEGLRTEHRFPPPLGQDSAEILTRVLGKSEDEVKNLIDSGAVFTKRRSS